MAISVVDMELHYQTPIVSYWIYFDITAYWFHSQAPSMNIAPHVRPVRLIKICMCCKIHSFPCGKQWSLLADVHLTSFSP